MLRYAISIEGKCEPAKGYVKKVESEDPDRVKLVREMLADEKPKPPSEPKK